MAAMVAEVSAVKAVEAHERHDLSSLAAVRSEAPGIVAEAASVVERHGVSPGIGSRQIADAYLQTARAFVRRIHGDDDPEAWADVAATWGRLVVPYEVARARWREAEARLTGSGRSGRAAARRPLLEATGIALELGAKPLLRKLRELGQRALITLPDDVDALLAESVPAVAALGLESSATNGHAPDEPSALVRGVAGEAPATEKARDPFGLSVRELEVLRLIAQGRTNPEIGERLFITRKTVGVHVGNILAKLGVSGRVEAAGVAIRLGMTDST
jgi:DNA-binding CsgD family transcriptional regulator